MKRTRRTHSAEFKARVALEAIKGIKTINQIARDEGVLPVQVSTGFLMIAGSNVAWILARQIGNGFLGHQVPVEFRYDNDRYHLLLIGSTFVLYEGIARGDWRHPHDHFSTVRQTPDRPP